MTIPQFLTDDIWIIGSLSGASLTSLRALGIKTIVNLRPDGESDDQLPNRVLADVARQLNFNYRYLPVASHEVLSAAASADVLDTLTRLSRPLVLACASGQRAAVAWAAAMSQTMAIDEVLDITTRAGFNLELLRDDLAALSLQQTVVPSVVAFAEATERR